MTLAAQAIRRTVIYFTSSPIPFLTWFVSLSLSLSLPSLPLSLSHSFSLSLSLSVPNPWQLVLRAQQTQFIEYLRWPLHARLGTNNLYFVNFHINELEDFDMNVPGLSILFFSVAHTAAATIATNFRRASQMSERKKEEWTQFVLLINHNRMWFWVHCIRNFVKR